MIDSRDISELHPAVQRRLTAMVRDCKAAGLDFIVTSTYRDAACQNALYAQGRTKPGRIVTNARAGQSMHNYRLAFDIAPRRLGKLVWGTNGNGIDADPTDDDKDDLELWQRIAAIGKKHGLEWAGDWKKFREYPHFQFTAGLSLADLQAGKKVPDGA